jgi:hypothetical protein
MSEERRVRTKDGLIPWRSLDDHGFSILKIKNWREVEYRADRPHGLADFYVAHGLCSDCGAQGVRMIGWIEPSTEEDFEAAKALDVKLLPLWEVCPACSGTGKA